MNKKVLVTLTVGIGLVLLLIASYIWGDQISPNDTGSAYDYERLTRSLIIILISIVAIRLFMMVIIYPLEERRGSKFPNIIKDLIGFFIFAIGTTFIITNIYDQSAFSMLVALGGSSLGIIFVAQDFLKEIIQGIVIDVQNDFRIGDWVKFPDGTIGKIIRTKLTGVDLRLADGSQLYVNNTSFTNRDMINLNQPDKPFFNNVKVLLEHDVPVDRGRRILYAAAINAPGVYENNILVVAESVHENGILFGVYYKIPNQDVWLEVRHQIISSISKHLHRHNLKICEISGNYQIKNLDQNFMMRPFNDNMVTNELESLKLSGLLKGCSEDLQKHFSKRMEKCHYSKENTIVSQGDDGDTMFIIAEGVVDVFVNVSVIEKNGDIKTSSNFVANLADGEYFGEMALLCGEKRNATVIAKTDVIVYEIRRETIKTFVKEYPDFAKKLSLSIIERNLENESVTNNAIEKLNEKEKTVSVFMETFKTFLGAD